MTSSNDGAPSLPPQPGPHGSLGLILIVLVVAGVHVMASGAERTDGHIHCHRALDRALTVADTARVLDLAVVDRSLVPNTTCRAILREELAENAQ